MFVECFAVRYFRCSACSVAWQILTSASSPPSPSCFQAVPLLLQDRPEVETIARKNKADIVVNRYLGTRIWTDLSHARMARRG